MPSSTPHPGQNQWTKRQRDAFTQRADETADEFAARTIRTLRLRDHPRLLMLRSKDEKQIEAIQLYAQLLMVKWTRALTIGTVILGACTIVAAFIVRG